jgi:acyl dehydratase
MSGVPVTERTSAAEVTELDLSDVEGRVGQPVGGAQLWDPCSSSDIRRWVMAMDYPNPLHWDEEFARGSRFGGLVAPQSIAVALDYGHGAQPACVGRIPGSHLIFGGEEWWFYGVPVRPGDKLFQQRRFHDYKVTETKFAGPTVFSRGDTTHTNQAGALVARERSTAIRYLRAEATRRGLYDSQLGEVKRWTEPELAKVEQERHDWILSNRLGISPRFGEVKVGDHLPRRVIGPHSIATFTTEYRAFVFGIWGTFHWVDAPGVADSWVNQDPGWVDGFAFDEDGARIDPRKRDGLYLGPSRGHIDGDRASQVGMARAYGYGATMGAWCTDYLAYWAGHEGMVRHSRASFRTPAFEGDLTYFDAEVTGKETESAWGVPLVQLRLRLTNQDAGVLVDCTAEVELPL